jgi:UMF1 family MFS transporter
MTDKTPDNGVDDGISEETSFLAGNADALAVAGTMEDRRIPVIANTGAVAAVGLDLQEGKVVPRKQVVSWAFWDWATQPFNSVILTFVFTALYLVSDSFLPAEIVALPEGDPLRERALADLASGLGLAGTIAGLAIFALAPVLGQRADAFGRRKRWLLIYTGALVLVMFSLFFVEAAPAFFALGVGLIAIGSVFSELAGVNYNAMLVQVSTPRTIGRVSGLGWGLGYIGGIIALVIVLVANAFDWFGLDTSNGMAYRLIAVGCAVWAILFTIPLILNVPELPAAAGRPKVNFFQSYVVLVKDIAKLFRESRPTFWFLLASAVYRDGLAGVFAYGAVIAAVVFGFSADQVIVFGVAANLVAGASTIIAGRFDDIVGARAVILTALIGLVVAGMIVFFLHDAGDVIFWIFGLALCVFVGPAQASSRSLLARVTPAGREGEIFGLYATTGRAASFLSPALWTLLIAVFGATYWGILGIIAVIAVGLVLMLLVKLPPHVRQ